MGEFEQFWAAYPRKVGKLAARSAFDAALKKHGATLEQLLAGVERYKRHKPDYADWAHPRTWLCQGRWLDEYKMAQPEPTEDWFTECKRIHGGECGLSQMRHHHRKQIDAGKAER